MGRLLDEQTLVKIIDNHLNDKNQLDDDITCILEEVPTVEAVPVVRCKNCTRWGTGVVGETEHVKCCEFGRYMVGENGYCVYGELRTSAE